MSFARAEMSERRVAPEKLAEVIDLSPIDRFRELVSALVDGIVVIDGAGKVRLVNPAAESLLGRPGRDIVGRPVGIPIEGRGASQFELARPDGTGVVLDVRTAAVEWDGESCVVASIRDVTERAGTDEQQALLIERLRELDRLRTDFIGIVSHDLRSPMATISGFVDTLRANWSRFDEDHKMRMLDRISRSTNQLARLVENILHVSQIESGKLNYAIKDIDLAELIDRVVDENSGEPDRIRVSIEGDLPPVRGDDIRQWQILTNLVTNALKFSRPDQPVEIAAHRSGDHVEVSVRDEGIGIEPRDKDRLFEKFTRLDQPEGLDVKGSGLGLYICKAMVEAQGGTIRVESEPGRGATFAYTVPTT